MEFSTSTVINYILPLAVSIWTQFNTIILLLVIGCIAILLLGALISAIRR